MSFTAEEMAQLSALAVKSGLSRRDYLRALVREQHMQLVQAGYLEPISAEEHIVAVRTIKFMDTRPADRSTRSDMDQEPRA